MSDTRRDERKEGLAGLGSGWAKRKGLWIKLTILVVLIAGLAIGSAFLPIGGAILDLLSWTGELGFWGAVLLGAFYIPACVLMLPGGLITMGAGFLFGLVTGTIVVSIGSTLGAAAAFLVGRTFARHWVRKQVENKPKFRAVDQAVGREGFKIVFLTRLSPIFPFNFLNYAYGLTDVKLGSYVLASWIGMLPGTVAYVYLGTGLRALTREAVGNVQDGWAQRALFWAGLAVTFVVVILVTRVASKAMAQSIDSQSVDKDPQDGQEEGEY